MSKAALETAGLTKFSGSTRGIEDLDVRIEEGEVFGYLGPNGAGETTTIRLLLDLVGVVLFSILTGNYEDHRKHYGDPDRGPPGACRLSTAAPTGRVRVIARPRICTHANRCRA